MASDMGKTKNFLELQWELSKPNLVVLFLSTFFNIVDLNFFIRS